VRTRIAVILHRPNNDRTTNFTSSPSLSSDLLFHGLVLLEHLIQEIPAFAADAVAIEEEEAEGRKEAGLGCQHQRLERDEVTVAVAGQSEFLETGGREGGRE
jgi:hypothetical protein